MSDSPSNGARTAAGQGNEVQLKLLADARNIDREIRGRRIELRASPVEPTFDSAHLTAIHERLMGGYALVPGDRRVTNVSPDGKALNRSAPGPDDILGREQAAFDRLRANGMLQGRTREEFANGLADHLNELRVIGSFRSGTEHVLAAYAEQVADQAGYRLDMDRVPTKLLQSTSPSAASPSHLGKLRNQLRAQSTPYSALAFKAARESGTRDAAIDLHPELQSAFAHADLAMKEMEGAANPTAAWNQYDRTMKELQRRLEEGQRVAPPGDLLNGHALGRARGAEMLM